MQHTLKLANLLFALCFFSCAFSFAQGRVQPDAYIKSYPKADAVLHNSTETYTWIVDKATGNLFVDVTTDEQIAPLKINQTVKRTVFYNDQEEILDAQAQDLNIKKKSRVIGVCGNYEVNSIFYSDAKVCVYPLKSSAAGDIILLSYKKRYKDVKYLTSVYFTDDVPTITKKFVFRVPNAVAVELKEFNFQGFNVQKKVTKDRDNNIYEYVVSNLPAMGEESALKGTSHVYPHVLVLTKSYTSGKDKITLLNSTEDLYKWYTGLVQNVEGNTDAIKTLVNQLIANKTTNEEKIKAIYYWVQDNIRYIAFEDGIAGFKPATAEMVHKNKYGDCKGMANLAKNMLKIAGFDARLTWIGTNHIVYDYSYPSLAVDNHMICTLLLDGKQYFLDPTESYCSFNDYAERIQGRPVMIEDNNKFILSKVPMLPIERNTVTLEQSYELKGEILVGTSKAVYNGEKKGALLYYINNTEKSSKNTLLESVVGKDKNMNIKKLEPSSTTEREKPLILNMEFELLNQVSTFDKEIYVDLDWYKDFAGSEIEKTRIFDYKLGSRTLQKTTVSLKIPQNHTVKHLPEKVDIKTANFTIKASFEQKNGLVVYTKEILVPTGVIAKADFAAWNSAIATLKKLYDDRVILEKK
jgi:transglutaminase-like putative cysteine protease